MRLREEIGCGLEALVIFRSLRDDPLIHALMQFCQTDSQNTLSGIRCYSEMAAALYCHGDDLTTYMEQLVLTHENVCVRRSGAGQPIPAHMMQCLFTELKLLTRVASLTPAQLQAEMPFCVPLPGWNTHEVDLTVLYQERLSQIHCHGYGIYARWHMFTLGQAGELLPVTCPDPITLEDLAGYTRERQVVIDNTKALLRGKVASNVLLSGDAGTGKSATVKAIANAFRKEGLRLIELNKNQLCHIPRLMEKLSGNPLKFILFIDDLTFSENDPDFGMLKAILEGSVAARMKNTVIYATSNRRHLVKETFDDGSDKHQNDTIQERISLSERFGITVTFSRPPKKLYLEIVHALAEQAGLKMSPEELEAEAERFALQKCGRSARAARQLIDQLLVQQ